MTQPVYKNLDGLKVAKLIDFLENPLSVDPATPVDGLKWYNTTDKKFRYYNGSSIHTFATMEDVAALGELRGDHDASTGNPPSAVDISKGDYWRVTVAGTIVGLGGPTSVVEPGDVIFARIDNAIATNEFFAVQANKDFSIFVNQETIVLASLPASTPTDVVPTVLSEIGNYLILDSSNNDLTISFDVIVNQGVPKITLTSLVAQSNLNIIFQGKP